MINGVVFGLSTPRRHGNSKSSSFMEEIGMPLGKPKEPEYFPEGFKTSPIKTTGSINKPNSYEFKRN
jgi:hypothetical protein